MPCAIDNFERFLYYAKKLVAMYCYRKAKDDSVSIQDIMAGISIISEPAQKDNKFWWHANYANANMAEAGMFYMVAYNWAKGDLHMYAVTDGRLSISIRDISDIANADWPTVSLISFNTPVCLDVKGGN